MQIQINQIYKNSQDKTFIPLGLVTEESDLNQKLAFVTINNQVVRYFLTDKLKETEFKELIESCDSSYFDYLNLFYDYDVPQNCFYVPFQHYKGTIYFSLFTAIDLQLNAPTYIYVNPNEPTKYWARQAADFKLS